MEKARMLLDAHPDALRLDVRTEAEYLTGHLPGALLLPLDDIDEVSAQEAVPDYSAVLLVYCRTGKRSRLAIERLRALGYENLIDLGGLAGWPYELVSGWF